ncbi:hypothetical protein KFE25_012341 [Diacronema lutheri]|uniref:Uncharacterized protein n=1 Tax=Diacronema lutheri TaxID=2081491 RepID=A0A8J6CEV4_DIALT|nr:hypothetical protein KFE25_012341 [Diacronema lutheri]|mmetsp:Transcript_9717/g.30762  ORF Transcript_9717/g.30762 Transcript_9717/m.30762 type:complete len:103 (-) Transcript_9717:183-491(-)
MLSGCCPCLGRKTVEAFEQAQDKKFGKPSETAKETKGLLDTYGLDEDIEDAGEDGASAAHEFEVKGPISSDRIKALLDRQMALTNEIDNEFDDDDVDADKGK